jgi:site-specific DNA-methyltransferase (adenine-specific)
METNKIINGDCLELIKDIPDNSIDFILTDPPYFDNFKANWNAKEQYVNRTREGEPRKISCKEASMRSSFKRVEEINSQITPKDWFPDALRVLKKINMIIWLDDRKQLLDYLKLIDEFNLKYYLIVWHKTTATPNNNVYLKDKEIALYIYEKSPVNCNKDFESRKTVIPYRSNSGNNKDPNFVSWHPTPKPTYIIEKMILKHTNKNDVVLDLFSGSGTTSLIAKRLERQYLAFELDETYYKKSIERIKREGNQTRFDF